MPTEEATTGTRGLDIRLSRTNWGFKGRNYLFLIAIDKYRYWTKLRCAKNDVKKFARILKSKYQFEGENILYLPDYRATLRNILAVFRKLANKVTEHDNLIIYFSGHGHYIEEIKTGYWIPQNAHADNGYEDEFINTAVIVDKLRTIDSLHTFLIVDACFSGSLLKRKKGAVTRSEQHKSRRIFTSGRADELVDDGPEDGHSPFASAILHTLIENTDRYISASRLIVAVKENIKSDQTPEEGRADGDDGGDFVFHVKLSEEELWAFVLKQHKIEAYKKFAEQFPNSLHREEAIDASAWLAALEKNTINSFNNYLSAHLNGKFAPRAAEALCELYWQEAKSQDTLLAYRKYLHHCPDGKYVAQAQVEAKKFGQPQDEEIIERVLAKEIESHPRAIPLSEEKAWSDARAADTFISYQDFIKAYDHSKYLEEAKQRMNTLDKKASNPIKIESVSVNNLTDTNSDLPTKEKIRLLKELIKRCKDYFEKFPAAPNNRQVKEIKNTLEIRLLELLH